MDFVVWLSKTVGRNKISPIQMYSSFDTKALLGLLVFVIILFMMITAISSSSVVPPLVVPDFIPDPGSGIVTVTVPESVGAPPYTITYPTGEVVVVEDTHFEVPIDGFKPGGDYEFVFKGTGGETVKTYSYPIVPVTDAMNVQEGSQFVISWIEGDVNASKYVVSYIGANGTIIKKDVMPGVESYTLSDLLTEGNIGKIVELTITSVGTNGTTSSRVIQVPVTFRPPAPPSFGTLTRQGNVVSVPYVMNRADSSFDFIKDYAITSSDGQKKFSTRATDSLDFSFEPGSYYFKAVSRTALRNSAASRSATVRVPDTQSLPLEPSITVSQDDTGLVTVTCESSTLDPVYATITGFEVSTNTGRSSNGTGNPSSIDLTLPTGRYLLKARAMSPQGPGAWCDEVTINVL